MWQSRVEIEHYSVAYFNCITAFKALLHRTSVKGGTHYMCKLMNTYLIYTARVSPALNRSSALERFECGNAIIICNRIMISTRDCHIYNKLLIKEHLYWEMREVCDAAKAYLGKHFCDHPEGGSVGDEDLIQYSLHSLNLQMLKINHAYLNALSRS